MANYYVIGGDQQEYGPATQLDIEEWINDGRLTGYSKVRHENSTDWLLLSNIPEFAEALRVQASKFPGATPPPAFSTAPSLVIADCLTQSGRLLAANLPLLAGASALVWLLHTVAQFTPLLGGMISTVLEGVLYGGLYIVFLKRIRGEETSISEVFYGFGSSFTQLVLVGLLTTLLSGIGLIFCVVPWLYLTVAWVFAVPLVVDRGMDFWPAMQLSRRTADRVWFKVLWLLILAFLPVILANFYAQARMWATAYPAIQEMMRTGGPSFQNWMALMNDLARSSIPLVLANKVVLLFTLPFATGAVMYAYEQLFGTRQGR